MVVISIILVSNVAWIVLGDEAKQNLSLSHGDDICAVCSFDEAYRSVSSFSGQVDIIDEGNKTTFFISITGVPTSSISRAGNGYHVHSWEDSNVTDISETCDIAGVIYGITLGGMEKLAFEADGSIERTDEVTQMKLRGEADGGNIMGLVIVVHDKDTRDSSSRAPGTDPDRVAQGNLPQDLNGPKLGCCKVTQVPCDALDNATAHASGITGEIMVVFLCVAFVTVFRGVEFALRV